MSWHTHRRPPSFVLLLIATTWLAMADLRASERFDSNPFDPSRKPWKHEQKKEASPTLPELTPKDLQIEAIISFGQFRGIIAQLDGRLKGALPANAAGKVRIQVGHSFGGGYVLSGLETNQVMVRSGDQHFTIPLLRKVSKAGAPAPAIPPIEQSPITPAAQPAPVAIEAHSPPPAAPVIPASGNPFAGPVPPLQPEPSAPKPPPIAEAPQTQPGQPMSLLDAIRKAEEAAAKSRTNPVQQGIPFTGKQ